MQILVKQQDVCKLSSKERGHDNPMALLEIQYEVQYGRIKNTSGLKQDCTHTATRLSRSHLRPLP